MTIGILPDSRNDTGRSLGSGNNVGDGHKGQDESRLEQHDAGE